MYLRYLVKKEDAGQTAETVLRRNLKISGALSRRLRTEGGLTLDGKFILNRATVPEGGLLEVRLEDKGGHPGPLKPREPIPIYFEDEWFALVGKPPHTPTHPRFPGDRGLTTILSDQVLHPANRLDMDTSGLVLIAKNGYAHHLLSITPIKKVYYGLVHGKLPDEGLIDLPIGRAPDSVILRMVREDGKPSRTHYRLLAYWPAQEASLAAFRLETGRTHQIRVHCQAIGHPLVGDTLYGWEQTFRVRSEIRGRNRANYLLSDRRDFSDPTLARDFTALALNRELDRQFLHAARLRFAHPVTGELLDIEAPLTSDLELLIQKLNRNEKAIPGSYDQESLFSLDLPANVDAIG